MDKVKDLFKSRKFWGSIVGLGVSLGLVQAGGEESLVEALLVIAISISYVIGTGLEDMGKGAKVEPREPREPNVAGRS